MSSFLFRSRPRADFGIALAVGILAAGSAFAQQGAPSVPSAAGHLPHAMSHPSALPSAAQNGLPQQAEQPVLQQPMSQVRPPESRISLPAGATIGDAESRVRTIASEAGRTLDELVGGGMAPREQFDVDAISERQRRVMRLKHQLEEAKLARQLWQELHGTENGEDKSSERVKKLEEEKEFLEKRLREAEARDASQSGAASDGAQDIPVVSSINGIGGTATARVLIPFVGVVTASAGTTLPNGMKITSISPAGVVASKDGNSFTLPYGTSVLRFKASPKAGQGPLVGLGGLPQVQR